VPAWGELIVYVRLAINRIAGAAVSLVQFIQRIDARALFTIDGMLSQSAKIQ